MKKTALLALLLATAVSAAGCALLPDEEAEENLPSITPPKLSQKPVYTVATDTIESRVRGNGELKSIQMEQLFFVDGDKRVQDVYVKAGQYVEAGELLAELDTSAIERDLRTRKLKFRQNELAMIEVLRKADEMEPEELEQAKIDFELARSEIVDMEESVERAKLYAPFSGNVISVQIKKGDQVQAYTPVILVADMRQLVIAATINKDDVKNVAIGMETTVSINSAGEFKGKVSQLPVVTTSNNNNNNNNQTDSLEKYLLVDIGPMPEGLNLGTPLSVVVITNRKENAIVIPPSTLRNYAGRNYVQVVEEDGTRREVDVEVGQQTSTVVEIVKGLTPGQKVVGR